MFCLPIATKEKRAKPDGSGTSQMPSDKHKVKNFRDVRLTTQHLKLFSTLNFDIVSQIDDTEEKKREKQARMNKMEALMKEMEELMKLNGNLS